ncbi:serine/threonine protein kinase [Agarivorans sp. Toyoura001]|uniref:serine/threonine-protein kinase n=1 Tax=Agarivorans sp. Toyoura001 TaxID=2283141 RepID=UPI0010DE46FA|nr:serine/threonine-protein kinase [Agarivorans sp. Toyoura001]GDY25319.1 serine/threonine protein kinase [Agarivorans sp. Toyoura001]
MDDVNKDQTATPKKKAEQAANSSGSNDKTVVSNTETVTPKKSKAHTPNDQMLNRVIKKRYQIEGLVGHGGMCDVYRAKDLLLEAAGDSQPYVAIKLLQKEFHDQPDAARILIREARKTQRLSHPNIIRVYDFGVDQEDYYLVMEWLDGQTLDEVIKSHRPNGLSYKSSLALLQQLTSALSYAHENGVVHADLKPGNIMLSRDGTIKIFDFGVSRALNLNADQYAADKPEETSPVSGFTPTYASPELLDGAAPSIADDVFAFSCIAYELLSSKHPFNRKTANQAAKEKIIPAKPKHAPLIRWASLKKGLKFELNQRTTDLSKLEKGLTNSYFKPTFAVACGIALIGSVAYGYQQTELQFNQSQQALETLQRVELANQELVALTPQQFLPILSTIPVKQHVPKQAMLRDKQRLVIDYYEKQIDDLLNNRDSAYPDYYAIQSLLQEVNRIYPDSYSLALIAEDVNQGWMGTVEALSQRLDTNLEQGRYQHSEDGDDIYLIYQDLLQVRTDYQFAPNEKSEKMFTQLFDKAADDLDVVALADMISAGETFFANSEQQQARIARAAELKSSISAMAEYKQAIANEQEADFPYQAAEVFYQNHFAQMQERIDGLTRVKTLDKMAREVDVMAKELPNDFSHLVETRQSMANKYLRFSDYLLKKRRTKEASAVMKKAQDLMTKVQDARVADNA